MTKTEEWFEKLRILWVEKDIDALSGLVADEFEYFESPFEEPITSVEKLKEVWEGVKEQNIQSLEIESLITGDIEGLARYTFINKTVDGSIQESVGAYYVLLNTEGRAVEFRQWWMNKD